jgi:transcriptional regulator with GAF, ATPase, and Fis domain
VESGGHTVTDVLAGRRDARPPSRRQPVLYVALRAGAPLEPPSRHLLDGIDVVAFGRGPRAAVRDTHEGLRRLSLRVPDPLVSSDHGRLLRAHGQWLIDDPRSKNGVVVGGRPTRLATVPLGEVFELGHTLFLLDAAEIAPDARADLSAEDLHAPAEGLATLDPALEREVAALVQVAAAGVPVLLCGDTGTGKELFARALHELSGRRGAFVAVNCGGLAPNLVEAELFGHKKGAFTGATADRPGYLRAADGGTLFLDEVAELPLPAQAALLRALQQHEVVPVGESRPEPVDLRLCAATHRDLAALVATGAFREDLYARVLGVTLRLPPLRERRGDLGLLVGALLPRVPGGARARFTPAAAYALLRHDYPLNVRELERGLAAAVALSGGEPIGLAHLPEVMAGVPAAESSAPPPPGGDDPELRATLVPLLARHEGNVAAVARELGKHREQVHRWVRRLGVDVASFRKR